MKTTKQSMESGQALILIALAAIGLFGIAGLAIDGSVKFADRRHAQNAADAAALAAGLSRINGDVQWKLTALDRALSNGYDNNLVSNIVNVYSCDETGSNCGPYAGNDRYVKVLITSNVNTHFARVTGINLAHNTVEAIAMAKTGYTGPPFGGNAIVSLAQSGNGFDAHGTPVWTITGGGIMVNSAGPSSATCGGTAGVNSPSITTADDQTNFSCHTVNIGSITTSVPQLTYSSYSSWFPRQPACNGTATQSGGQWHPQSGADGSRVAFSGDMDFAPGLYCVTNSPGSYHGALTGSEVTFYITSSNFNMKFNGSGNSFNATAPTSGEYKGVLIYLAPQVDANGNLLNTQALDLRGNGDADIIGTIIAPSADVTMFGNSGTGTINSQVIAYQVDTGGSADITVTYSSNDNWFLDIPNEVGLFQ